MTDDDFKKLTIEEYDNYYWPILRTIWDKNACLSGADHLGNDAGEASKRPKLGRMPLDGRQRHPSNFHFGLILILFHLLFSEMVIGSRFS
jgi:hypothetical protein